MGFIGFSLHLSTNHSIRDSSVGVWLEAASLALLISSKLLTVKEQKSEHECMQSKTSTTHKLLGCSCKERTSERCLGRVKKILGGQFHDWICDGCGARKSLLGGSNHERPRDFAWGLVLFVLRTPDGSCEYQKLQRILKESSLCRLHLPYFPGVTPFSFDTVDLLRCC